MADYTAAGFIGPDHPCLAGHFPGHPVVPAVVLLDFTARALGEALGRRVRVTAVPQAKFLSPLAPGQPFTVELTLDPQRAGAKFTIATPSAELAHGRLEYADEA